MSLGDFSNLCGKWSEYSLIYSCEGRPESRGMDLRIRFTKIRVSLCPDIVLLSNDSGDSMIVRDVSCVRVGRSGLPGVDMVSFRFGYEPKTSEIVLYKIPKTH